jgi:SAV_6107-like HEPN
MVSPPSTPASTPTPIPASTEASTQASSQVATQAVTQADTQAATRTPASARRPDPLPAPPALTATAVECLAQARRALVEAGATTEHTRRYACAHVAALRAAAAVLAVRARPHPRGQRNAWVLLARVAPELEEWAAFFAAGAAKRSAAEAGLARAVTIREADDLLRDAECFCDVVEQVLGVVSQPLLPGQLPVSSGQPDRRAG